MPRKPKLETEHFLLYMIDKIQKHGGVLTRLQLACAIDEYYRLHGEDKTRQIMQISNYTNRYKLFVNGNKNRGDSKQDKRLMLVQNWEYQLKQLQVGNNYK